MSEILITRLDHGSTCLANQGDVILIRLEENITTGYQWDIGMVDDSMVELLDSEYYSSSKKEGLLGSPGTRTFRFKTKSSGTAPIRLRLRRPWDPVDTAIEYFEVFLQIQ